MSYGPNAASAGRLHHDKGYESETESDADVPGGGGPVRDQTQEIAEQDE